MKYFALVAPLALFGCDKIVDTTARDDARRAAETTESLEDRVAHLERLQSDATALSNLSARLRPSDNKAWQPVDASIGTLTVSLQDVSAFANGSRIKLRFGNPTSANIMRLSMVLFYGSTNAEGAQTGAVKRSEHVIDRTLAAGGWTDVSVDLADIPPSKLGYVDVTTVEANRIGLDSAQE